MEFIDESSSSSNKVEPGNLLEECWFFGNLLIDSKPKMARCNSDPCPSSNYNNTREETSVTSLKSLPSTKKNPKGDKFGRPKLVRAPSLPVSMAREAQEKETIDLGGKKSNNIPRNNLIRAPSLPPCIRRAEEEDDDDEDQESEFTLGRLIRQASLNSSHVLPPRQTSKSSSVQKQYRPRKKPDQLESINMVKCKETGPTNQTKMRRSISEIQFKQDQDFKASILNVDKEGSNVVNKYSNFQEKATGESDEKTVRRREPWPVRSSAPRIPKWGENEKRSAQDMKAQIKFWARAVASNVRAPGVLITNQ